MDQLRKRKQSSGIRQESEGIESLKSRNQNSQGNKGVVAMLNQALRRGRSQVGTEEEEQKQYAEQTDRSHLAQVTERRLLNQTAVTNISQIQGRTQSQQSFSGFQREAETAADFGQGQSKTRLQLQTKTRLARYNTGRELEFSQSERSRAQSESLPSADERISSEESKNLNNKEASRSSKGNQVLSKDTSQSESEWGSNNQSSQKVKIASPNKSLQKKLTGRYSAENSNHGKENKSSRKLMIIVLDHKVFTYIMTALTVYALFGDDLRLLFFTKSADFFFDLLTSISMLAFVVEIVISSIAKKDEYLFSFYFWLDVIATISLILDISWIWNEITGVDDVEASQLGQLMRAGRGARIGTKAGRIVRIVRILRLVRIMKLYKHSKAALQNEDDTPKSTFQKIKAPKSRFPALKKKQMKRASTVQAVQTQSSGMLAEQVLSQTDKVQPESNIIIQNSEKNFDNPIKRYSDLERGHEKERSSNLQDGNGQQQQSEIEVDLDKEPNSFLEITNDNYSNNHEELDDVEKNRQEFTAKDENQIDQVVEEQKEALPESLVGKQLSDLTTRKVIILVLAMMFSDPLLTYSTYYEANTSYQFGLDLLREYYSGDDQQEFKKFEAMFNEYVDQHSKLSTPLINIKARSLTWLSQSTQIDELRASEKELIIIRPDLQDELNEDEHYLAIFDLRFTTRLTAALSITRTCFVCAILAFGSLYFSKDAHEIVILPIEQMIRKVNSIARNPIEAAQDEAATQAIENETSGKKNSNQIIEQEKQQKLLYKLQQMIKKRLLCQNSDGDQAKNSKLLSHHDGPYETVILEQTIVKIGALLAQGFGEAGTKIIADNMAKTQGSVDPMIPGNKVVAIFGFCDIRSFTKLTNVLQERIIVFVNEIADIVHGTVDKFSGAANKNIGNSFLLVWKFEEEDTVFDANRGNQVPIQNSPRVKQLADMSVISFLKILAQIKKSYYLDKFMRRKEVVRKLKANKVHMGFGLHTGWAIEGAIGSDFKIDASYLSPNVNLASRIQAATVQYGLPIIISGDLYKIFTKTTQSYMRQIDCVTVKGSSQPIDLHTCDLDFSRIQVEPSKEKENNQSHTEKQFKKVEQRIERARLQQQCMGVPGDSEGQHFHIATMFREDEDLKEVVLRFRQDRATFLEMFANGFVKYKQGSWFEASAQLLKIKRTQFFDGFVDQPTLNLLNYMDQFKYIAPPDWKGYRALTEK